MERRRSTCKTWRGALRVVVDDVHDLALLEIVAGRQVGE
jgi:hypothetical protein